MTKGATMLKKTVMAGALAAAFTPGFVLAQQAPASPPPAAEKPAESGPITIGGFELTGYVDVGYTHLSGKGQFAPAGPGGGFPNRVFDFDRNSLNLHQVGLTLANQPKEGFGGLLNLTVGKDADVIASYKTDPSNGGVCNLATGLNTNPAMPGSCDKDRFDVTQAFLQYATGPVTIIGGKYVTLAGAEVINSTANTNYSRSILFGYAIPFTHTGLRVKYDFSDTFSLTGGVNQGWDDIKDTNSSKGYEIGVAFAPSKILSLSAMLHGGKERIGGLINTGPEGTRNLIDLVATFNATDKLTFILNYDYGTQDNAAAGGGKAKWDGWAGYANYQINDQWRASLRGEYFDDRDGYRTGVIQKWKEATFTVGYSPLKNLELRAEVRADRSNVAAFVDSNGVTASKHQNSYGLQAIYKF